MEGLEEFKGKMVKVVYRDIDNLGRETRAIKIGKLMSSDEDFIYLFSDSKIAIPKNIVQRIEIQRMEGIDGDKK